MSAVQCGIICLLIDDLYQINCAHEQKYHAMAMHYMGKVDGVATMANKTDTIFTFEDRIKQI